MTDAYTRVSKPTDSTYTKVYALGKEAWDDPSVEWDDSVTCWNGGDGSGYTKVPKPTDHRQILPGMITGLMIPLTYNQTGTPGDSYTRVAKPIS
jgi:hypothetical protein